MYGYRIIASMLIVHSLLWSPQAQTKAVSASDTIGSIQGIGQPAIEIVEGLSAEQLWQQLHTEKLPAGVTITKLSFTGAARACGSYKNFPVINAIKPKDGIIMATGYAVTAKGPNDKADATGILKNGGDADLAQFAGGKSEDAQSLVIEFDTDTTIKGLSFDFVFGSEEYYEWVGQKYNDIFCAILDGKNICFDGNNNLICIDNNFFIIDNCWKTPKILNLQYDGFTPLLRTSDSLKAGHHVLKLAISDIRDYLFDSGVFLSNFQFKFTKKGTNPVRQLIEDQTFSIEENVPGLTRVGTVALICPDSLIAKIQVKFQNVAVEFECNAQTRIISVAAGATLDFETKNSYSFRAIATLNDSIRDTAILTILVKDIDEGIISDQSFSVKENSPAATPVGTIALNVPDTVPVQLLMLDVMPEFSFDLKSRKISVAAGALLDFETKNGYQTRLAATAPGKNNDTALITIAVLDENELPAPPFIDSALILDKDGNGVADSIQLTMKSPFTVLFPSTAQWTWPDNGVSGNQPLSPSNCVTANRCAFTFLPQPGAAVVTTGSGPITLAFDSLKVKIERTGMLKDGIGPLLRKASVVERFEEGCDTLFVTLTEPIYTDRVVGDAFILIKNYGKPDQTMSTLTLASKAKNSGDDSKTIFFAVSSKKESAPKAGDYLRILSTGPVIDMRYNHSHPDNTPVPIELIARPVPIQGAVYSDNDGDGVVETIRIEFLRPVVSLSSLNINVTWKQDGKSGIVKEFAPDQKDSCCIIGHLDNIFGPQPLHNRTGGAMDLTVRWTAFNTSSTYPVLDGAAPVITRAVYSIKISDSHRRQVENDTVQVQFSEPVQSIRVAEPFCFINAQADTYVLELQPLSLQSTAATFLVAAMIPAGYPSQEDSIWIAVHGKVADTLNNFQEVKNNKRVRLEMAMPQVHFRLRCLGPIDPQHDVLPHALTADAKTLFTTPLTKGIAFVLEPDVVLPQSIASAINCSCIIIDPLGSSIGSGIRLNESNNRHVQMFQSTDLKKGSCVILWSAQNDRGRWIGPGAYYASVMVFYNGVKIQQERLLIAVKKER
ncbi:MAG: cadherin repeat domain-containing protein [Chitinivibrionales bacterium]|nr:cadherin repeat domain-containing protein [Chitinivibrionales bacterium]